MASAIKGQNFKSKLTNIFNYNNSTLPLIILQLITINKTTPAIATIITRPLSAAATLVPGQSLHFECNQIGHPAAQFKW